MKNFQKLIAGAIFCVGLLFLQNLTFAQSVEQVKLEIYSNLKDRRCNDSLDQCNCSDAKEMKAYIDALLEVGVSKDEVFYKVAKKFSLSSIIDNQLKTKIEKRLIKELGGKMPQVFLEQTFLNFGEVSKKQNTVSKILKVYNKGNVDLIINNLRVTCSCITVALKNGNNQSPYFNVMGAPPGWQEKVAPGQFAELVVMLDLIHPSMALGKQIRDVFISSNDPINLESKIVAEIVVKE